MEQFVVIATAHLLALLIPGADFLLIARISMTSGWRPATGACLGIAAANGLFIALAFGGIGLLASPLAVQLIQLAGGAFLILLGFSFVRSARSIRLEAGAGEGRSSWRRSLGRGLASGLMNPKNALFYLGLAAAVPGAAPVVLVGYGTWMIVVVLGWDLAVAVLLGTCSARERLGRIVPWLARIAGCLLVVLGASMLGSLLLPLLGGPPV